MNEASLFIGILAVFHKCYQMVLIKLIQPEEKITQKVLHYIL